MVRGTDGGAAMRLTEALAQSRAKHPTPHHDRITWTGVRYSNPVHLPDSWLACDTCSRMAVYGTDSGTTRARKWCHDCYLDHAQQVRDDADDYANQVGDPAPAVDQTYGDTP